MPTLDSITVKVPPFDAFSLDAATLTFLGQLLRVTKPHVVVEAGTYYGHFANVAGSVVKPYGGHVYTADTIDYCRRGAAGDNGLQDVISFTHNDFAQLAVEHPDIVGHVDVAFIDSGPPFAYLWEHTCRLRHYELAKSWVRPTGLVIVDDITTPDWFGADQIRAEAGLRLDVGHGLALWQKP